MPNQKIYQHLSLGPDEVVLKVVRQTAAGLVVKLLLPAVLIASDFFLLTSWLSLGVKGLAIFSLLLVVAVVLASRSVVVWYFKTLVVTNQKVVDIDQTGLFKKTVSTAALADIQDVFYQTTGLLQAILKTGNVHIKLKDGKTRLDIKQVIKPHALQQTILDHRPEASPTNQLSKTELLNIIQKIKQVVGEKKFDQLLQDQTNQDKS